MTINFKDPETRYLIDYANMKGGLIKHQKNDGRWDTWYGISEGTKLEWAGIQTLWTLKVLKNYNRVEY